MSNFQQKDYERTQYLLALYEFTGGDTMTGRAQFRVINQRLEMDETSGSLTAQYLVDHDLAKWVAMGGIIGITASGADEAERIMNAGGEVALSVSVLSIDEQRAVEAFLTEYRRADESGEIELDAEGKAQLEITVRSMELQLQSPKPKRRIIGALLSEIHLLLSGAAGSGVWEASKLLFRALHGN